MIGAISEDSFVRGEKRSLISLQMCFMGWLYELLAIVAGLLGALIGYQMQHELSIPNIHFPDVILVFLLIPFIHLLNDEDTKGIIFDRGWIQGIKFVLGIHKDLLPGEEDASSGAIQNPRKDRNMPPNASSHTIANLTTSQRRLIYRKCKSSINGSLKDMFLPPKEKMHLERRCSLRQNVESGSSWLINGERVFKLPQIVAQSVSTEIIQNEIQTNISTQSSHSSLSTIYIDS